MTKDTYTAALAAVDELSIAGLIPDAKTKAAEKARITLLYKNKK
jgi:hypothetical protein